MTIQEIIDLFEMLELHLIGSLKRNLLHHQKQEWDEGGKNGVPAHWESWQSAKIRDVRRFRRENEEILETYMPTIEAETEQILQDQYTESSSGAFFSSSDPKLRSLIHEMQHNEARVKQGCLRYMDDVYRKTILRTATAMSAGGMSLHKAVDEATADFLSQGITCIRYANGRLVNISSYAEMALRTCNTRAMLMGEAKQREQMGIDTVLVSQYGACSGTCLPWQGKVYIDDVFQAYGGPRTGTFGISRNGRQYMRLSVAIKGGLFHPNCRHVCSSWIEGVSTMPKPMDVKEIERVNKLEKTQRAMERKVRKAKRQAAGLADSEAQKAAKAKVRAVQAELREFVKKNGDVLRRDYWRERDSLKTTLQTQKNADIHDYDLEKAQNRDILESTEMFKKKSAARKTFKPISDKQFNDLTIEVQKQGATIIRGTEAVEKHLEESGATASCIGGTLLFKKDVCISEVLEETRHFMQNLNGMNSDKLEPLRTYLNEIDARRYIIGYSGKYVVPREEIKQAQIELENYQHLLEEYKKGANDA